MNYFRGYKKKRSKSGFVGEYTKGALSLSLGSQILEQPQFGSIGLQGAQGLGLAAGFLPPIATIGVGGYVIGQVRKLGKKSRSRR